MMASKNKVENVIRQLKKVQPNQRRPAEVKLLSAILPQIILDPIILSCFVQMAKLHRSDRGPNAIMDNLDRLLQVFPAERNPEHLMAIKNALPGSLKGLNIYR